MLVDRPPTGKNYISLSQLSTYSHIHQPDYLQKKPGGGSVCIEGRNAWGFDIRMHHGHPRYYLRTCEPSEDRRRRHVLGYTTTSFWHSQQGLSLRDSYTSSESGKEELDDNEVEVEVGKTGKENDKEVGNVEEVTQGEKEESKREHGDLSRDQDDNRPTKRARLT